jgi:hypothetical protein
MIRSAQRFVPICQILWRCETSEPSRMIFVSFMAFDREVSEEFHDPIRRNQLYL